MKQAYKPELLKKWKINNIFHMSLLEQDITKKRPIEIAIKLNKGNSKDYKVQAICNTAIYDSKLENHLPCLYYLVL